MAAPFSTFKNDHQTHQTWAQNKFDLHFKGCVNSDLKIYCENIPWHFKGMLIPGSPNWDGHGLSPQNWRDICFPNPSVQDMCPEKKKKRKKNGGLIRQVYLILSFLIFV
jgi:hypothetical protein